MDKDYVVSIMDGCNFHSIVGINNLIDRCLITINEDDKITMHRLLRDMGREIIRQEALDHPGKRSRLWNYKDAFTVLCNKTGTESIRGFNLNLAMQGKDKVAGTFSTDSASMLSQQDHPSKRCLGLSPHPPASLSYTMEDLYLETEGFAKMHSLMLLRLYDVVLLALRLSGILMDDATGLLVEINKARKVKAARDPRLRDCTLLPKSIAQAKKEAVTLPEAREEDVGGLGSDLMIYPMQMPPWGLASIDQLILPWDAYCLCQRNQDGTCRIISYGGACLRCYRDLLDASCA